MAQNSISRHRDSFALWTTRDFSPAVKDAVHVRVGILVLNTIMILRDIFLGVDSWYLVKSHADSAWTKKLRPPSNQSIDRSTAWSGHQNSCNVFPGKVQNYQQRRKTRNDCFLFTSEKKRLKKPDETIDKNDLKKQQKSKSSASKLTMSMRKFDRKNGHQKDGLFFLWK